MTELEVITTLIDEYRNDILKVEKARERHMERLSRIPENCVELRKALLVRVDNLDTLLIEKTMRILALARASRMIERALETELNK